MNPIREDLVKVRCITVMVFCLLLSSCTKQQSLQQKSNNDQMLVDNQNRILDLIIQQEAMLIDVPIPLFDNRIIPSNFISISDTLVFGYKSSLSRAQIIDFFMNQMERYGWQHQVTFEAVESLLQFASPDRFCTVTVKSDVQDSSSFFVYVKKASPEARL